jgi:beta-galactosidase/beta-glucuronidase
MAGTGVCARFCPSSKVQSDYWQTGPTLLTVGPWRPVSLHTYHTRISDLHISALVDESLDADLIVRIAISPPETSGIVEVSLKDSAGSIVTSQSNITVDHDAGTRAVFHFKKGEVKLWYPVGYGEQPLYGVQVKVLDDVRSLLIVGENLLTEVIGVAKPITGYQNSKGWVSPRARSGGQTGRPTRTHLALRNK